jgi:hypothetical protein
LDARLTTLLCKQITVTTSKEVKTRWSTNLAESFKEGCGSKGAVLSMMMMMMMMMVDEAKLSVAYKMRL